MEVKRLRLVALETFNAFNKNFPSFLKDCFEKNENSVSKKNDLKMPIRNSATFRDNSSRSLASCLGFSTKTIKTETPYVKFKEEWFGRKCKCSLHKTHLYKASIK